MQIRFFERPRWRRGSWALTAAGGAMLLAGAALALDAKPLQRVSQKGRAFNPGEIALARGATMLLVNDDGDLLHHAYVDAADFKFDSGDQEPGSKTEITFPLAGTFTVLCGIHPKMRLVVNVN